MRQLVGSLAFNCQRKRVQYLHKRFIAYKRNQKDIDGNQDKINKAMLHLDRKVKEQKKWLLELEAKLPALRGEVVGLHPQLAFTKRVRD